MIAAADAAVVALLACTHVAANRRASLRATATTFLPAMSTRAAFSPRYAVGGIWRLNAHVSFS